MCQGVATACAQEKMPAGTGHIGADRSPSVSGIHWLWEDAWGRPVQQVWFWARGSVLQPSLVLESVQPQSFIDRRTEVLMGKMGSSQPVGSILRPVVF